MKKQIMIIDAHPVIEEGIDKGIQDYPDLVIAASVDSAETALVELRQVLIDVIIIEMMLPDMDGAEVIAIIRDEFPDIDILVYSSREDEATVHRALKAGAKGYILKTRPLEELFQAIRQSQFNHYMLSPELNPAIIDFYLENRGKYEDPIASYQSLTRRERQVFRLLAEGRQTREIARYLCISPKTVAKHRAAIKKKLSLKNPAEMAQYAIKSGLIDIGQTQQGKEVDAGDDLSPGQG